MRRDTREKRKGRGRRGHGREREGKRKERNNILLQGLQAEV